MQETVLFAWNMDTTVKMYHKLTSQSKTELKLQRKLLKVPEIDTIDIVWKSIT